ncbi:hypothetical protein DUNSADRAFT_7061 [Dunaliella salina]|uniref:Uncharacterized protein n=1 Tax=Dunaliella salina TaxID=3046 RepID=A0ABQ7H6G7_DUNSA|nr:hypothetical protein DUNSADRAFT_7061 [Dunaliella salina]|eukprot:KAF5842452.1 hypothetical protein DUNSADRAFT_7061 [Dunaliella salina]
MSQWGASEKVVFCTFASPLLASLSIFHDIDMESFYSSGFDLIFLAFNHIG